MASTAPENADGVAELVRLACGERGLRRRDAEFFNDDKNLSWAMDAVVQVKKMALAAAGPRVYDNENYEYRIRGGRGGRGACAGIGRVQGRCFAAGGRHRGGGALPGWLPESRLMSAVQTLTLNSLGSLESLEGLSGCTALQTLRLDRFPSLASLEGVSGCTALQTLTLVSGLESLASLEGVSGCTALQTLTRVIGKPLAAYCRRSSWGTSTRSLQCRTCRPSPT